MTASTNYASPLPHASCGRCRERREMSGNPDPRVWACGDRHRASALGQAAIAPTFFDGGSGAGRAAIDAKIRTTADAPDIRIDCAAFASCGIYRMFPPGTDATSVERFLDVMGWTAGDETVLSDEPSADTRPVIVGSRTRYARTVAGPRYCSATCAAEHTSRAPPPPAPEPLDEDDEALRLLLGDSLGSVRPMGRGTAPWERRQQIILGCVARRETIAAYAARVGRTKLLAELHGVADEAPQERAADPAPVAQADTFVAERIAALAGPPHGRQDGHQAADAPGFAVDRLGRRLPSGTPFRPR